MHTLLFRDHCLKPLAGVAIHRGALPLPIRMTGQLIDYRENCPERAGTASLDVTARAEQQMDKRENKQETRLSGIEPGTGYAS